jgi:hypothetical protein
VENFTLQVKVAIIEISQRCSTIRVGVCVCARARARAATRASALARRLTNDHISHVERSLPVTDV